MTVNKTIKTLVPIEVIERKIYLLRGQKVMLDSDLANLYGVTTKRLNEQMRRNIKRFPEDFMFQLTPEEYEFLRSQIATLSWSQKGAAKIIAKHEWGKHRKYLPYAFTEQGVAMLSSVLNSKRAIDVNIRIMRTFVKLREMIATHKDLATKLEALEKKYDGRFQVVFEAIRKLMKPRKSKQRKIGFKVS